MSFGGCRVCFIFHLYFVSCRWCVWHTLKVIRQISGALKPILHLVGQTLAELKIKKFKKTPETYSSRTISLSIYPTTTPHDDTTVGDVATGQTTVGQPRWPTFPSFFPPHLSLLFLLLPFPLFTFATPFPSLLADGYMFSPPPCYWPATLTKPSPLFPSLPLPYSVPFPSLLTTASSDNTSPPPAPACGCPTHFLLQALVLAPFAILLTVQQSLPPPLGTVGSHGGHCCHRRRLYLKPLWDALHSTNFYFLAHVNNYLYHSKFL